jgi:hypothetical protein
MQFLVSYSSFVFPTNKGFNPLFHYRLNVLSTIKSLSYRTHFAAVFSERVKLDLFLTKQEFAGPKRGEK